MDSNRISRRSLLRLFGVGAAATVLAACQPRVVEVEKEVTKIVSEEKVVTATPAPKGKTEIVYYERTTSAPRWGEAYDKAQDEVKVKVEIQPPGTRYEQLIAAMTAGNAPDVIGLDCVQVGRFANIHALAPLEDVIPQNVLDLYFENLVGTANHYGNYGGHLLGVPFWVDSSVLFYNKTLLEEAGGDPDAGIRSWDDYATYGKPATKEGRFGFATCCCLGNGFLSMPWIWAQGVTHIDAEYTQPTFLLPEIIDTFQFVRDLATVHKIVNDPIGSGWGEMTNLFTAGKAMFIHQGGGLVGLTRTEFPELFEVLGTCPIPGPKVGQKSSFIGGNVASMSMACKKQREALDFIIWVTSSDEGMAVTGEVGFLPGCARGLQAPVFQKDGGIYAAFEDALTWGFPSYNHPRMAEAGSPWGDAWCAACKPDRPIPEILQEAEDRVMDIVTRW